MGVRPLKSATGYEIEHCSLFSPLHKRFSQMIVKYQKAEMFVERNDHNYDEYIISCLF